MARGRPSRAYEREEFRTFLSETIRARGLSLRTLADLTRVDRGTLSRVLRGLRPCEETDREALLQGLGAGPEVCKRFLSGLSVQDDSALALIRRPDDCFDSRLQKGLDLLAGSAYLQARLELERVFRASTESREWVLQADAAARLAQLHSEVHEYGASITWAGRNFDIVKVHLGLSDLKTIHLVRPASNDHDTLRALRSLSRALHFCTISLFEYDIYDQAWRGIYACANTIGIFAISSGLDMSLQKFDVAASPLARAYHADKFRTLSVWFAASAGGFQRLTLGALSASRAMYARGTLGEAYITRDHGVAYWQLDRLSRARQYVMEAVDRLSAFADAPALGLTLYVLSRIVLQTGGDLREARRTAISAAALHPYGFILHHARELAANGDRQELRRDMDALLAGERPFVGIHKVMMILARSSSTSAEDLIRQNLALVLVDGSVGCMLLER